MQSILNKQWKIKNTDPKLSLFQKLLHNRNLHTETEIERFLHPNLTRDLHDPFLMEDMQLAVDRIKRAIGNNERIIVFGDYDIDGITGTAILIRILQKLGAVVSYRLPHRRHDGYGLREKFIAEFAKADVKILITVDNGISCKHEIALAKEKGIDVIITDHHSIPEEIPKAAYAILHPKLPGTRYPFYELTGSAVAFKFAEALIKTFYPRSQQDEEILPLLDLAAMGTISDLGPLVGENRAIVKFGLEILGNTRWPGLSRLKEIAGVRNPVSVYNVGFHIGPRINAAGRMSDPYYALQLLLSDDEKSDALAQKLDQFNRERQKITTQFFTEAEERIKTQIDTNEKILIVLDAKWHTGLVGLLAGKLMEKYYKPVLVMEERGDTLVGSARSPVLFNITDALTRCKKYLVNFGGHAQAAGFELAKKDLPNFEEQMRTIANEQLNGVSLTPTLSLDSELNEADISFETETMIQNLSPFGMGNEIPCFLLQHVLPIAIATVGREQKHLKFTAAIGNKMIDCIGFSLGHAKSYLQERQPIDLACELIKDEWNGRQRLQLKIVDIRTSCLI